MVRRALLGCAVLGCLYTGRTVRAEPATRETTQDGAPSPFDGGPSWEQSDTPGGPDAHDRRKSYLIPAVEGLAINLCLGLASRAIGYDWAEVTLDTIEDNFTNMWVVDEDPFTINHIGHPYLGALLFTAARSTGHGFWVSGLYTFGGSLIWELFMETSPPAINDQIITTISGMLVGEVMHRFSRALRYPGFSRDGLTRKLAATAIDPIGAINRRAWGEPWTDSPPPSFYGHFGIGYQEQTTVVGNRGGEGQFHTEVFVEHGLVRDPMFEPHKPLDHFELRGALDASRDDLDISLSVRGLIAGRSGWSRRGRAVGGLFGAYDFDNNENVRTSLFGFGPGATGEGQFGDRGYVGGTIAGYVLPWGAAGGATEGVTDIEEEEMRDYHRGPGFGQLVELKVGRRGTGSLRLTARAYQIMAKLAGDDTNELAVRATLGGQLHLSTHHALGIEGSYGLRRATSSDPFMDGPAYDSTSQIRAFWAITTDELLGH